MLSLDSLEGWPSFRKSHVWFDVCYWRMCCITKYLRRSHVLCYKLPTEVGRCFWNKVTTIKNLSRQLHNIKTSQRLADLASVGDNLFITPFTYADCRNSTASPTIKLVEKCFLEILFHVLKQSGVCQR